MTKKEIIEEIFNHCKTNGNFIFDNDLVKDILHNAGSSNNPYDMTKIDDLSKLPEKLVESRKFIDA